MVLLNPRRSECHAHLRILLREMQHALQLFLPERQHDEGPRLPEVRQEAGAEDVPLREGAPRGGEEPAEDGMPPVDEAKMEKAMAMLAGEAEKLNEDDPRQAAQLMRKLTDATGMNLGAGMEEALHRLEKGEDPDQIEAEMGDLLEGEEPFVMGEKGQKGRRKPKPRVDETLYDL